MLPPLFADEYETPGANGEKAWTCTVPDGVNVNALVELSKNLFD
jgi:hypothetical protein